MTPNIVTLSSNSKVVTCFLLLNVCDNDVNEANGNCDDNAAADGLEEFSLNMFL